mgnify:CR=1 FL=1
MKRKRVLSKGSTVTIRLSQDLPDELIREMQRLRERGKLNQFINEAILYYWRSVQPNSFPVVLPDDPGEELAQWLQHPKTQEAIGRFLYLLLVKGQVDFEFKPPEQREEPKPQPKLSPVSKNLALAGIVDDLD